MTNESKGSTTSNKDRYANKRREKRIQNVKSIGSLMMYIGSAGLMIPMIRKAKENQNALMGICATGAGAVLSVGMGNAAGKIFEKTVDKVVDVWDDVNPRGMDSSKKKDSEDEDDG